MPFPGGGINDVLARIVGEKLQTRWGQPIVIENKTGAGGNIGAELAYQSEGDGYTLLLSPPGPLAVNQSLYKQLSYKPQEFVPITVVGSVPNVVIVRKELPVNSLKELIDYVKANPGKVTFGSQGNGATPHLTGMMFQGMTGTAHGARALPRRESGAQRHDRRSRRCVLRQHRRGRTAVPRRTG